MDLLPKFCNTEPKTHMEFGDRLENFPHLRYIGVVNEKDSLFWDEVKAATVLLSSYLIVRKITPKRKYETFEKWYKNIMDTYGKK